MANVTITPTDNGPYLVEEPSRSSMPTEPT
jgi:hypothetical protein